MPTPKGVFIMSFVDKVTAIRNINDLFRKTFDKKYGVVFLSNQTARLFEQGSPGFFEMINAIRTFDNFTSGDDPYKEHDFFSIVIQDEKLFIKIDYYTPDLKGGSEYPECIDRCQRVLNIIHSSDY